MGPNVVYKPLQMLRQLLHSLGLVALQQGHTRQMHMRVYPEVGRPLLNS